MTQEEKAKAYDEALSRAKNVVNCKANDREHGTSICEYIFPEISDSKDEKFRKYILKCCEETIQANDRGLELSMDTTKKLKNWLERQGDNNNQNWKPSKGQINALEHFVRSIGESGYASPYDDNTKLLYSLINDLYKLEKQGEQKPVDKVEPKFKVGDFIVNDYCMGRVVEITNDAYLLDTEQGIPFSCEHNIHLWTIADANDGDVLVSRYGNPLIYNGNYNSLNIGAYCGMTCDDNKFKVAEEKCHWTENVDIKPSTKEQRDLLFAKMKEAGYEWDAENKELKKIEQKDFAPKEDIDGEKKSKLTPFDKKIRDFLFSFYREVSDGISLNEMIDGANKLNTMLSNAEQKSAWSDEDKEMFKLCVDAVEYYYTTEEENRIYKWLKSLKDRVQPKQEWSDEDERERKRIIGLLEGWLSTFKETCYAEDCKCGIDWLKSLKDRATWKPNEEQMQVFETVYEWYNNNFVPSETLTSLYNDLKKFEYSKKII